MKIYAVEPDTKYRMLYPEDAISKSKIWNFNGKPLLGKLPKQFQAYFEKDSNEPLPDIAYIGMMTFAFRSDVATALADILEGAGELLPFYVGKDVWYCLNVTTIEDVVDTDKSTYEIDDDEARFGLKTVSFNTKKAKEKLKKASLFKIPNDNYTTIYCVDNRDTDKQVLNNFFCAVAAHKFTGIDFIEVYCDEK